jgi:malto-oligosyltrehalose synthase
VVEKILGAGEHLPFDWAVDGTSGYDFMDDVNALLHDPSGETPLQQFWHAVSGRDTDFVVEEAIARREVLDSSFTAQLDALVAMLHRIARRQLATRDVTKAAIRRTLTALIAHFPVYRTYGSGEQSFADNAAFTKAMAGAMDECRPADRHVLALLDRWLGGTPTGESGPLHSMAIVRFQQLTAPLAAKAVEDTAFYRYGVLLSRNEVGADATRFSATADEFHDSCKARRNHFPDAMLATATHDHKRGEDVRARLAVLSEMPEAWNATVDRWLELNAPHRRAGDEPMPSFGDEAMLYQMIVGAWPTELAASDTAGLRAYTERLAAWQLKAAREAKVATCWMAPDLEYEDAARSFLYAIMANRNGFVVEAVRVARRIGPAGAVNGLAQMLLKATAPGVPDFYQGSEFWDLSLVDPDNRRNVDLARRNQALRCQNTPVALATSWRDGRVKQSVLARALAVRRANGALFARGAYWPIDVRGPRADRVVAFARTHDDACLATIVPRLPYALLGNSDSISIPASSWGATELVLPRALIGRCLRDAISGDCSGPLDATLPVARALGTFPAALLTTS